MTVSIGEKSGFRDLCASLGVLFSTVKLIKLNNNVLYIFKNFTFLKLELCLSMRLVHCKNWRKTNETETNFSFSKKNWAEDEARDWILNL